MKRKPGFGGGRLKAGGFTLTEIMVVIVIIGILMTGMLKVGSYVRTNAQIKNTKIIISELAAALDEYKIYIKNLPGYDFPPGNRPPTPLFPLGDPPPLGDAIDFNGIWILFETLNQVPSCKAILNRISEKNRMAYIDPVLRESYTILVDAWVNENTGQLNWLHYEYVPGEGNFPVIRSAGPDTIFGTADDIVSTDM